MRQRFRRQLQARLEQENRHHHFVRHVLAEWNETAVLVDRNVVVCQGGCIERADNNMVSKRKMRYLAQIEIVVLFVIVQRKQKALIQFALDFVVPKETTDFRFVLMHSKIQGFFRTKNGYFFVAWKASDDIGNVTNSQRFKLVDFLKFLICSIFLIFFYWFI